MGAVYEAEHTILDRQVAIKLLHPQFAEDEEALQRFYREARTASKLGHEGIIEIIDVGQAEDGSPYLVMEMLTGESLGELLEREDILEPRFALDLTAQILSVLVAVHEQGIVHRDLKPDNMFLCPRLDGTFQLKILDFGICKIASDDTGPKLTRTGIAMGTPYYMSREQARGDRELDHRTDIWSTGTILYEMLTGHVPYEEEHYNLVITRLLTEDYLHPRELNPSLPESLEQVVLRAMALEPEDRYPTASDFLADVLDVREKAEGIGIMDTGPDRTSVDVELPEARQDTEPDKTSLELEEPTIASGEFTDQGLTIAEETTSKREGNQPEAQESTLLQGYEIAKTPEEPPQQPAENGTVDTFMAVTTSGTTGRKKRSRSPMWLVGAGLAVVVGGGLLMGAVIWFAASSRGEEPIELAEPSGVTVPVSATKAPEPEPVGTPAIPLLPSVSDTPEVQAQDETDVPLVPSAEVTADDVEPTVEVSPEESTSPASEGESEEPMQPRPPEKTDRRNSRPEPVSSRPPTKVEPSEPPSTQEHLTQAEVRRGLARNGAQVRRCLAHGGSPPRTLRIRVRVDGQGRTHYLGASPTPPTSATRCLWNLFGGIRFRATGGSSIEASHTFRGRGLQASPFDK